MANSQYFNAYPGDYIRDTAHLTLEQHGAYWLLMCHAYSNGGSLPADMRSIGRILGVHTNKATKLWKTIGVFWEWHEAPEEQYPPKTPPQFEGGMRSQPGGVFRQKRIDKELAQAAERSRKQSEKAKKRWNAAGYAGAMPTRSKTNDLSEGVPSDRSLTERARDEEKEKKASDRKVLEATFHERFWPLYPRKEGRKPALAAWCKHVTPELLEDVLAGLTLCKASHQWQDPQYVPLATTWINQARWEDTPTVPQPENRPNGGAHHAPNRPLSAVERVERANKLGRWAEPRGPDGGPVGQDDPPVWPSVGKLVR